MTATDTTPRNPLMGLLVAQFLGAFNDNAFKMLVALLAMGTVIGTRAFVAAVIGGIGSIPGAMLGGLLLGILGELTKLTPYSSLQDVLIFIALVGVLLVRPSGLLGKTTVEKV